MRRNERGKRIEFDRVSLVLDVTDADTPAMVYAGRGDRYSASYECAMDTGLLADRMSDDFFSLSPQDLADLERYEEEVNECAMNARAGGICYCGASKAAFRADCGEHA